MNDTVVRNIIVSCCATAAIVSLWLWLQVDMPMSLEARVPGMDKAEAEVAIEGSRTGPEGTLIRSDGVPADIQGAWPCFRGPDLDNISKEPHTPLPKGSGFKELWSLDVGEGFAGAVIADGRVYMIDYDREQQTDALRCLSLADGKEIWRYSYPVSIKRNHGMSRTVPTVTEDVVVSIGPKCIVTCLHPITGEKKWSIDMVHAYETEVPPWYAGQCPLIDQGRLILAPAGTALLTAIDCETGEVIWETPNPRKWKMTHSSVVPMEFKGRHTYLYCASGGVVGVSAEDGRLLWEFPEWTIQIANIPSPLVIGEDKIFLSGGYKAGSLMLQLEENDGAITPNVLYRLEADQFGSTQHTPIYYEGYIYGVRPDGQLVCLDVDGNIQWSSTSAYKFGLGPYMIAPPLLYVMDDNGLMSRVEATPEAFRLWDQTPVLDGHEAWAPIAFTAGRMIVRDLTKMVCIEAAAAN